jgi:hypothetical protein
MENQKSENRICEDFVFNNCKKESCENTHIKKICKNFWNDSNCKFGNNCRYKHINKENESVEFRNLDDRKDKNKNKNKNKRVKNTTCFEPLQRHPDLRFVFDTATTTKFEQQLQSRDVVVVPNLFSNFKPGEMYDKLLAEIENCPVDNQKLIKIWHGNDKIAGTHFIVDDKQNWKNDCYFFNYVIDVVSNFFNMKVVSTRFNIYKDTDNWKPFHRDAAAVKPHIAKKQNFTVAVSFGVSRTAAFQHMKNDIVISLPHGDGYVYAFCNDTNIDWMHGILQEKEKKEIGRISIILWGWKDDIEQIGSRT